MVVLALEEHLLLGLFLLDYAGGGDLVNPDLAVGVRVEGLADLHDESLPLGANQLFLDEMQGAPQILGTLVSDQLNEHFNVVLVSLVFEGDFLIEDVLIGEGGGDLAGDGLPPELEVDPAGESDVDGDVEHTQRVAVDIGLGIHLIQILYNLIPIQ